MPLELKVEALDWDSMTKEMHAAAWGVTVAHSTNWPTVSALVKIGCGNSQSWLAPDDAELVGKMLIRCAAEARKSVQE